jgi:hypothetical protein
LTTQTGLVISVTRTPSCAHHLSRNIAEALHPCIQKTGRQQSELHPFAPLKIQKDDMLANESSDSEYGQVGMPQEVRLQAKMNIQQGAVIAIQSRPVPWHPLVKSRW